MRGVPRVLASGWDSLLGFALPPRCAGCGIITDQLHSFCARCWTAIEWLGDRGCVTCGLPLEATDIETCAKCLAEEPTIQRTRAAVAYGELTRTLPLRLKYSRKVALARTMARYMWPLLSPAEGAVLMPVPLHRSRLWARGFNQSALLARELGRLSGLAVDPFILRRRRRTAPLKGMNPTRRRREVSGAFEVERKDGIRGRTVILVDDVLTSGSTAEACARTLRRAGANRIELVCWARVVRPGRLMR